MLPEEGLGDLHVDAGAVAGLAVCVDRAAVPDRLERLDAGDHHLAPRPPVDRGDQPDAAGVVLLGRIVEALAGEALGFASPLLLQVAIRAILQLIGHSASRHYSAATGTASAGILFLR